MGEGAPTMLTCSNFPSSFFFPFCCRYGAYQLSAFCLHFIASNFVAFSAKPEFEALGGENRRYVEEHQWPPKSYLEALAAYQREHGDENGLKGDAVKPCTIM